jgi:RNA polymerase sigma factor (sigma-70 family)
VLIKAHRRWPAIGAGNPDAYLKQALVHKHLSWRRRRASSEIATATVGDVASVEAFDDDHASREEAWSLLARLPPAQRAVLVLRYFEDLDDRRIAELVGSSASTVRVNAHRGLHALRETLGQAEPRVGQALARRADQAPAGAELLDNVRRGAAAAARRRRLIGGVAGTAAAVTLVAVLTLLGSSLLRPTASVPPAVTSPHPSPSAALSLAACPDMFDALVAPVESTGGDLVPPGATGARLCAYWPPMTPVEDGLALTGTRDLVGSPQALVDHLNGLRVKDDSLLPPGSKWGCTAVRYEEYQIVIGYPDRSIVVSISRNCGTVWRGDAVRLLDDLAPVTDLFGLGDGEHVTPP